MTVALDTLQWLRPQWLWALLAVPVALALWWRRRRATNAWSAVVDAHLLPALLDRGVERRGAWMAVTASMAAVLAIVAMAGPSLGVTTQPLWQTRTPLVIVLDLSNAALAADVPPNRLAVARVKIGQVLAARAGAQVALVAYAGEAFTIVPMTDDAANVALFLDALHPDVMPVQGRDTAVALDHAAAMLVRGGFRSGRVLLMTDSADAAAVSAAARLRSTGYVLDVLGLGSQRGAPVPGPRGIQTARLDGAVLRSLAQAGGGDYAATTLDTADLRALGAFNAERMDGVATRAKGTQRRDDGYWLLPVVLLLSIWAFRRRAVVAMLAVCVTLPAMEAHADAWRRPDQQAHARMVEGHEAYRRGDFDAAARDYAAARGAAAHYNRGNALAKAGDYPGAIAAYDQSLRAQPRMADAVANRAAVLAAMKRKPPPGGKRPNPQASKPGSQSPGSKGSPSEQPGQGKTPSSTSPPSTPPPSQPTPPASTPPPTARDAAARDAQRAADAAQRERMRAAAARAGSSKPLTPGNTPTQPRESAEQRERRIANEAMLRRVPDDPGSLLRTRLRLEHERRQYEGRRP